MTKALAAVTERMNLWNWSPREKIAARRAFDAALTRELQDLIKATKERAERLQTPSDLWELESWIAEQRRRIDRTFDFRYSVLHIVFATLIRDSRLNENELDGLAEEKLDTIRRIGQISSQ
jgi:hypothetical protein